MTLTDRLPPSPDPDILVEAFADWAYEEQGLSLYPAQEEALLEIVTGANVILSTPTGSGKSLVAIGAHAAALARGERAFYTAPIKALVSEKFFALIDVFGADKVGMLTGDAAVNESAPSICEKRRCGELRGDPGTDEGVDDHEIRVAVVKLRDAAPTVQAAYFNPATRRQRQILPYKGGQLGVWLQDDLGRGWAGRGDVPRQCHCRAANVHDT